MPFEAYPNQECKWDLTIKITHQSDGNLHNQAPPARPSTKHKELVSNYKPIQVTNKIREGGTTTT